MRGEWERVSGVSVGRVRVRAERADGRARVERVEGAQGVSGKVRARGERGRGRARVEWGENVQKDERVVSGERTCKG